MKFKEFITEGKRPSLYDVISVLHADCQPFIKEFILPQSGRIDWLYRGSGSYNDEMRRVKVRSNRTPKDMHPEIHNDLDKAFQKRFGFPARSSTSFVTGDYDAADAYGRVYMVFPIGRYKYIWHPRINDLYSEIVRIVPRTYWSKENPWIAKYEIEEINDNKDKYNDLRKQYNSEYGEYGDGQQGRWRYKRKDGSVMDYPRGLNKGEVWDYIKREFERTNTKEDIMYSSLEWIPDMEYSTYYKKNSSKYDNKRGKEMYDRAVLRYKNDIDDIVSGYTNTGIVKAAAGDNEVMIAVPELWVVPAHRDTRLGLQNWFLKNKNTKPTPEAVKEYEK